MIDDVSDATAAELLELWHAKIMCLDGLSQEAADVFGQLLAAGIVRNLLEPRRRYPLALRFAGSRDATLDAAITEALPPGITAAGERAANLVLFVRTDGELADIVGGGYATLTTPHLLLDLAFGHTVCLGPLVFATETACLACLVGRLSYYWGDVAPPSRPRMADHPGLAAGLAALAIGNVLCARTARWSIGRWPTTSPPTRCRPTASTGCRRARA